MESEVEKRLEILEEDFKDLKLQITKQGNLLQRVYDIIKGDDLGEQGIFTKVNFVSKRIDELEKKYNMLLYIGIGISIALIANKIGLLDLIRLLK